MVETGRTELLPQLDNSNPLTLLSMKRRDDATEELANGFKEKNHIYTTRDDIKSEVWIYNEGIYIPEGKSYIKEHCRKKLGLAYKPSIANDVVEKIMVDTFINSEKFFSFNIIDEIPVQNGILTLSTRKLSDFNPEKIFFSKLPVKYDPEAKCPIFKKHIETILKNPEDIPVIEEIFGYMLHKDYPIEKAIMLSGVGRNGKGKTIKLMEAFIGIDNIASIPLDHFESDPFVVSELVNKMANLPGDIDSKTITHTGTLKTLTGRDVINAARKFKTRIKFTNYAKMIFAANQLPMTRDSSDAWWDRWVVIEFPFHFYPPKVFSELTDPELIKWGKLMDTKMLDKLTSPEELSGLLNVALDGLDRLLKQEDFSYSKSNEDVKTLWLRKSNSCYAFIKDHAVEGYDSVVSKSDFRKEYSKYCKKNKVKPMGDKTIKYTLADELGASEKEIERVRHWCGFCLNIGQLNMTGENL